MNNKTNREYTPRMIRVQNAITEFLDEQFEENAEGMETSIQERESNLRYEIMNCPAEEFQEILFHMTREYWNGGGTNNGPVTPE